MSKRELECGHRPCRPWERMFAYVSFVVLAILTYHEAYVERITVWLFIFTVSLLISVACVAVVFWDARVTARLRRREQKRRAELRRQMVATPVAEASFENATGEWEYFYDPAPTT